MKAQQSACKYLYRAEEALALIIDLKLAKDQYLNLRIKARARVCNLYPACNTVLQAKKECYPEEITTTKTMAEVKLQSLLDTTTDRLCTVQNEVISGVLNKNKECSFEVISHLQMGTPQTQNYFLKSMVPLQMTPKTDSSEYITWQNPRPSSTKYYRTTELQFARESTEVLKNESNCIENQVSHLKPTALKIQESEIQVHDALLNTMVDGKVANDFAINA
ncbi:hypothetical protein ILUMI_16419 [Ignelater luminosus]|uniref:Uncharacterized protein n=1 Tax=Ignelater luminosus TaxID=2038154 RepID=A0A8K0G885_IGNLU|nr:hypothetical protein ILUMI_16419 [Ignelater luminosus]